MNINEAANLSGVSVRTLHHYDRIGLLCPGRHRENDYRDYSERDLDRLQQILFFKACGFSLADIKEILSSPSFDREKAFALQREYLLHEKARIDAMLHTLEETLDALKGGTHMTPKEKFRGFDISHNPYKEEARRLWGEAADKSSAHIEAMSEAERTTVSKGMDDLFRDLAAIQGLPPDSDAVQVAIGRMYRYFNQNFGYHYTPAAFAGVGQLYVQDPRFTESIDQYGQGLSAFLADAMGIFAAKQKSNGRA